MDRTNKIWGIAVATTLLAGVSAQENALVGQTAPMITVTDMSGSQKTIKEMERDGSPIFIFFINTQDNTSTAAANYINRIAAAYSPARTKWFGICNGPMDRLRAYQSELNPPYALFMDGTLASMQSFHAQASPTVVEVDRDGRVMHVWSGYSAAMLKRLNRAMAAANGVRPATLDFSKAPSTTAYGQAYIGGR